MTAPKKFLRGRPRKHEHRGPGPKIVTFAGRRVVDLNLSGIAAVVVAMMAASLEIERREAALATITDPDERAYAKATLANLRDALPHYPVRNVREAAQAAATWFAFRGMKVSAERCRKALFARQKIADTEKNTPGIDVLYQALARVSGRSRIPD